MAAAVANGSARGHKQVLGDTVDTSTFDQILEMDDDEDRDFSKSIVYGFFDQAETTFDNMQKAISRGNLQELSQLGHFLKGSSATLGLTKIKEACEKIQQIGAGKDESGTENITDQSLSLQYIKQILADVQKDYGDFAKRLKTFYGDVS